MPDLNYIQKLREAIRAVHGCDSRYIATTPVKEVFQGQTAWEGDVETFELLGHPKAPRCYAWGFEDEGRLISTAVLEMPPVDSPSMAVTVAIAAKARQLKGKL